MFKKKSYAPVNPTVIIVTSTIAKYKFFVLNFVHFLEQLDKENKTFNGIFASFRDDLINRMSFQILNFFCDIVSLGPVLFGTEIDDEIRHYQESNFPKFVDSGAKYIESIGANNFIYAEKIIGFYSFQILNFMNLNFVYRSSFINIETKNYDTERGEFDNKYRLLDFDEHVLDKNKTQKGNSKNSTAATSAAAAAAAAIKNTPHRSYYQNTNNRFKAFEAEDAASADKKGLKQTTTTTTPPPHGAKRNTKNETEYKNNRPAWNDVNTLNAGKPRYQPPPRFITNQTNQPNPYVSKKELLRQENLKKFSIFQKKNSKNNKLGKVTNEEKNAAPIDIEDDDDDTDTDNDFDASLYKQIDPVENNPNN